MEHARLADHWQICGTGSVVLHRRKKLGGAGLEETVLEEAGVHLPCLHPLFSESGSSEVVLVFLAFEREFAVAGSKKPSFFLHPLQRGMVGCESLPFPSDSPSTFTMKDIAYHPVFWCFSSQVFNVSG